MSVMIKMDMPKSCVVCDFMRTNDDLMSADYRYMYCGFPGMGDYVTDYTQCRLEKCPLLEVPAHGRLIDADELHSALRKRAKEFSNSEYGEGVKCGLADAREYIKIAPTIIPAGGM